MVADIHRIGVFALHQPTLHVRAVLESVFRLYTTAYTEVLHACAQRLTREQLEAMATYTSSSGATRQSARAISHGLASNPAIARVIEGVAAPLEGRLRQSLREHVASTLMSYLALLHAAEQAPDGRSHPPQFPKRLRPEDLDAARAHALDELARLADNSRRERELVADLQRTRQAETVSIPFVGVDPRYGCGLYLNRTTGRYYARLDVVAAKSRHGRPITAHGEYVDIKSGVIYTSAATPPVDDVPARLKTTQAAAYTSFGRGVKSILVPLEMGRYHESALRYAPVALLPHRRVDASGPTAGVPVSARLVRRPDRRREGGVRYELHVAFRLPAPAIDPSQPRALLALNRGIRHLYAAVVTDPDGTGVRQSALTLGAELRAIQMAHEQERRERQRRGASTRGRRRQGLIAKHHIAMLANEIVALARQHDAQVVMEDLASFSAPGGVRMATQGVAQAARARAQRAILNRRQFAALKHGIDNRLEVLGLPIARTVNAAFISRDCPHCGAREEKTPTERREWFTCASCGFAQDRDLVAAANIARKYVWLRQRGVEKQSGAALPERTPWSNFAHAHPIGWRPNA